MNPKILLTVCAAGLAAGLLLGRELHSEPSRADRTAQLFTEICVPFHLGTLDESPETFGLIRKDLILHEQRWVDPVSASFLHLQEHSCTISTNAPYSLTKAEGEVLAAKIEEIVAAIFPELAFDPKATLGDNVLFRAWMHGKVASPQRWGVSVYVHPDFGESAGSSVSLMGPRSS
ncbi:MULTISPECIES: hypothetical protein [unclassified Leisingera]|uniref:hypothetical protein n=1 Tax=unclassified Leisingera TaxID=2614906 RepID=UPI000492475C|nr:MULTISPECIES: hypothetical protein [unclassified Leisingera]KIC24575.1 hypothetical protein RA23_08430 [Leisingera sp. ANG-S3]KIC55568.1 hypothetical protein RA22_02180 [Leisingera sp. ANG-S]KID09301.1 hypothetical protein GC1_11565 [Leisingera sp. ANG1]